MGWCSATEIIDIAIGAALAVAEKVVDLSEQDTDDLISPFVISIATKLRGSDWDCEQDSYYFQRFPQELTGWDDREYAKWLGENINDDPTGSVWHVEQLALLQKRMS